ncbi:MAG: transcription elongation factor GreA [Peptococcaceae bacterium]|nr:transcription elongation factor GreA [Peptococcaceae bacterium]MEE0546376.1 transcription elongation factor GreA [Peptococcaceae bacterium]
MDEAVILTREGYENLKEELVNLKTVRRKEVAERLKQAIDFGDLSENSEYDDAKSEQAFIEGRIQTIEATLHNAQIIEDGTQSSGVVNIGSYVTVRDVEFDDIEEYRIVGTSEADPMQNKISNESPLGSSLLGKRQGQTIKVNAPAGIIEYEILKVSHDSAKEEA